MRVGIIGCGGMGSLHSSSLYELSELTEGEIRVTALADIRPALLEKQKELWKDAKTYEDGMKLLEKGGIDAVHICVPSFLHTKYAVKALEMGIHVFLEKPVCLEERDCIRLEEAEKASSAKIMVGHVVRFFREYAFLKSIHSQKKYGSLKSIVMKRIGGDIFRGWDNWFANPEKSGSVVMDLHIHDADFLRYLLGEPENFRSEVTRFPNGMVNQIITIYKYQDMFASVEAAWDLSGKLPFECSYRAQFEDAVIVYNSLHQPHFVIYETNGTVLDMDFSDTAAKKETADLGLPGDKPYLEEIRYFYDCILQKRPIVQASLMEGIQSMRLVKKEYEMACSMP